MRTGAGGEGEIYQNPWERRGLGNLEVWLFRKESVVWKGVATWKRKEGGGGREREEEVRALRLPLCLELEKRLG